MTLRSHFEPSRNVGVGRTRSQHTLFPDMALERLRLAAAGRRQTVADMEFPSKLEKEKPVSVSSVWNIVNFSVVKTGSDGNASELYKCKHCDYRGTRKNFPQHWKRVHEKLLECDQCSFKTHLPRQLAKHALMYHDANAEDSLKAKNKVVNFIRVIKENDTLYQCKVCATDCLSWSAFESHWQAVHHEVVFCPFCDYCTRHKATMKRHVDGQHLKVFGKKCDLCKYAAIHQSQLNRHYKVHHELSDDDLLEKSGIKKETQGQETALYRCILCKFTSKNLKGVRMHRSTFHRTNVESPDNTLKEKRENPFEEGKLTLIGNVHKCRRCDYVGNTANYFYLHWVRKHGESYKCDECSYRTGCSHTLKQHMAGHRVTAEKNHENIVSKEDTDLHRCRYCQKKLSSRENYVRHRNRKHKKIHCDAGGCKFKTRSVNKFMAHRKNMHGKLKDKKCKHCGYATSKQEKLNKHFKKKHQAET